MRRENDIAWTDDPLWYKDAIIYQLHVKAFLDSDGNGFGDFQGLNQKLDYLQDLGVNTLWLLPFYPSPLRDDGYDIADYRNVHPDYGTRRDFRAFVRAAHGRGLKVITELVVNHTSDQHPWFQAARRAPAGSAKRNFYVWSDTDKKFPETRIIFTDTETSNWAWDPEARAYYWHRFFSHQPDLNHNNPQVVKAIIRVMRFWLDLGVDGLRLDAIPYLCVREGTNNENLPETHEVIKQIRAVVDEHYDGRMLLAEANQWPEDVREYFGGGDECHMAYHFPIMPRMYMAVAQEDRHPIVEIMRQTPQIPSACQWAIFLRNHDELTLEMVTDRERDYMYRVYASDPRMRVNIGIRRRLAPLMDNDVDKIKLMNSLLLSMPGSPIVYYGDEIGMGDNIFLGDRNGVRTPMQWSPDRNAGFSKADPQRLYLPPIMDAVYGFEAVNVEAQSRDASSLLNWMKRLIAVRKSTQVFGRGTLRFLIPGNRKILAYVRELGAETVLCVVNLSRFAQPVELGLGEYRGRVPVEMLGHTPFPPIGDLPYLLTLPGYGVYWFLLTTEAEVPAWHEEWLPPAELPVLVLADGWKTFFPESSSGTRRELAGKLVGQLENETLPNFLPEQRWFGAKNDRIEEVRLAERVQWRRDEESWLLGWVRVRVRSEIHRYFLPLAIEWEAEDDDRVRALLPRALAKVRQRERPGLLFDALADERFCRALVLAIGAGESLAFGDGCLRFSATSIYPRLVADSPAQWRLRVPSAEGSNTTVVVGDRLFLKAYRHLREGINPEVEMGRFLADVSPFENVAALAGVLEYEGPSGDRLALAVLQQRVSSQGDAWTYTTDYLRRFAEEALLTAGSEMVLEPKQGHASYLSLVRILGQRTGELHRALAVTTGDPAFDPEPITDEDLSSWRQRITEDVATTLEKLRGRLDGLSESVRAQADAVLASRGVIEDRIRSLAASGVRGDKTRYHGDYHLGQVLVAENDFVIVDFEGEPARPLSERRAKSSPLKDVAGMMRSFSYAAAAALREVTADRPDDMRLLLPLAREWERATCAAFEAGYAAAVAECAAVPAKLEQRRLLVELFCLEKALYELRYELDNRPDWVAIPLGGLVALTDAEVA